MPKKFFSCLYEAAEKTIEHDGVEHAGYMSFMVLLSIFPFLIFFLSFMSFFGASKLGEHFINILLDNIPPNTIDIVKNRIIELSNVPPQSLMNLAIIGSVWTASSFVECLRTILNRVNEIKSPPTYIRRRLLSIFQFFTISGLISLAMVVLVVVPILLTKIPAVMKLIEGYTFLLNAMRYTLILLSLFFAVSYLYYTIPNARLNFIDVAPGAGLTVILWILSGNLLSRYIVYYPQLSIVYGSLGSIIVTLLFFYIINMLFIYGAEFNKAYFKYYKSDA